MDLRTFKEINEEKSVIAKINLLKEALELKGSCRVYRNEAQRNRNIEDEACWSREILAQDERAKWLYGEIIRELDPDGIMEG